MNEYYVIDCKTTGDNPYLDKIYQIGLVRYKGHIELTRSLFYIKDIRNKYFLPQETLDFIADNGLPREEVCKAVSNLLSHNFVVGKGNALFLTSFLQESDIPVAFSYLDCMEYVKQVAPFLKFYNFDKLIELFGFNAFSYENPYTECEKVQRLFLATFRLSRGRMLHDLAETPERYLSGYWEKKVKLETDANLSLFKDRYVVSSGTFNSFSTELIEQLIVQSGGFTQMYPNERTSIAIVGNTEFPATFQTRAFHDSLVRIRQNQDIRIISELELLYLLHGQFTWQRNVNSLYCPKPVEYNFMPVFIGGSHDVPEHQFLHFIPKEYKDTMNSRSFRRPPTLGDTNRGPGKS